MDDLKNKKLLKVMWLPDEERILFHIENEKFLRKNSGLYDSLLNYIDWRKWIISYKKKYDRWLKEDDSSVYNIKDEINMRMIDGLFAFNNMELESVKVFYWFDIDRTFNDDFEWEYCPLSNKKLLRLSSDYPLINALISPDYPLIFPLHNKKAVK